MSRSLDTLDPIFLPLAEQLIAKCREAQIPIAIINTRRTQAEQDANVRNGTSWVTHSKHQDGLAIDICPTALLDKKGWAPDSQLWQIIGKIGQELGLKWGVWFPDKSGTLRNIDLGHFEYREHGARPATGYEA